MRCCRRWRRSFGVIGAGAFNNTTMMTTNMNATQLIKTVDHAAAQNDRWLFIASLLLLGLFGVWVMRYFVKQHERLVEDHKQARECYQESLRGVVSEQSAMNARLVICLDNNTKALEQCRDELRCSNRRRRL